MIRGFAEFVVEDLACAWQQPTGRRGAIYHLPGEAIPTPDDVFGSPARISAVSSSNLEPSSPNLDFSPPNLAGKRNGDGCLIADRLPLPVVAAGMNFNESIFAVGKLSEEATYKDYLHVRIDDSRELMLRSFWA